MQKKLYKDPDRKMISGVLAGISDYINVDVTLVRIIYVILSLISTAFPGIILYIILAVVMPTKDEARNTYRNDSYRESTRNEDEEKTYHDVNYQDVPPKNETSDKKSYTKSGGSYSSNDHQ